MKSRSLCVAISVWLLSFGAVQADETDDLIKNLEKLLPSNMSVDSIAESPMTGVYNVRAGNQDLYVFSQGSHVMIGDVYDVDRRVNLGEEKKYAEMAAALDSIPESEMIVMGNMDAERHVTVFTDTDCGYCQRFHRTIADLAEGGLKVRYLMFPRAGLKSKSYQEAVSVWCADDQGEAMTLAKAGQTIEDKTCENPVAAQYQLGQQIGIRGTPTMILDSGKVIPGYLPAEQLLMEAGLN